ncbi:hypothetical protein ABZS66_36305 [Dactylosporangium sp. NPDC005572]|uniref:hypothetical protein n=1 Tax=Dactylosporangium sp. NPDC005572 TaxID=3156889 RepID=UPI0033A48A08
MFGPEIPLVSLPELPPERPQAQRTTRSFDEIAAELYKLTETLREELPFPRLVQLVLFQDETKTYLEAAEEAARRWPKSYETHRHNTLKGY